MSQKRLVEIAIRAKDESRAAFDSLGKSLDVGKLKTAGLSLGIAAVAAAIYKAGKTIYDFTAAMAAAGDEMEKMALRVGVSVEELDEFRFAVERGGGSIADVEVATRRLARAMSDARNGTSEQVEAFRRLGLESKDLVAKNGQMLSFADLLPRIADGIKELGSQSERIDLAQEIFGRGGTALLPMLEEGAAGLAKMRAEMQRYGGAMSTQFADRSAKFVDAHTNLANATQRLKEAVAEPFLVPFTNAVNKLAETISSSRTIALLTGDPRGGGSTLLGAVKAHGGAITEADILRARNLAVTGGDAGFRLPLGADVPPSMGALTADQLNAMIMIQRSIGAPKDYSTAFGASDYLRDWQQRMAQMPEFYQQNILSQMGSGADMQKPFEELGFVMDNVNEQVANLNNGYLMLSESQARATIELERWNSLSPMLQSSIMNISYSLDSAFYQVLTSTRAFGRAFVDALRQTFAQTLAGLVGGVITGGLTSIFTSKSLVASSDTKSMPGASMAFGAGRSMAYAYDAYNKAWAR